MNNKTFKNSVMKNLPVILDILGIGAFVGGSITAYKNAEKTNQAKIAHKDRIQAITNDFTDANGVVDSKNKFFKKAKRNEMAKHIGYVAKSQATTIALDGIGAACIVASDVISGKRYNEALKNVAAYASVAAAADLGAALDNNGVKTVEEKPKTKKKGETEEKSEENKDKNEIKFFKVDLNYDNSPFWKAAKGSQTYLSNHLGIVEKQYIEEYNRLGWYDLYSVLDTLGMDIYYSKIFGENFLRDHGLVSPDMDGKRLLNDSTNAVEVLAKQRPDCSLFNIYYTDADGERHLLDYEAPIDDYGRTGHLTLWIPYESKPITGRRPEIMKGSI